MKIEKPEEPDAPAEAEGYETIGQFYCAIEEGLKQLCEALGEPQVFCGDPARQITPETFEYRGSGRIIPVYDLASALAAIDEIEEQGEGLKHAEVWDGDRDMFHPEREEVAHYFRFIEIARGRSFQRGDTPASGPSGPAFDVDWRPSTRCVRTRGRRTSTAAARSSRSSASSTCSTRTCCATCTARSTGNGSGCTDRAGDAAVEDAGAGTDADADRRRRDDRRARLRVHAAGGADAGRRTRPIASTWSRTAPTSSAGACRSTASRSCFSELHEPLTWRKDETLESDATYRLCRCGQSSQKPFCDNTHARVGFDGSETAPTSPSAARARRFVGTKITMTDDSVLCMHAGFCGNHAEKVWQMLEHTDDTRVRFTVMQMVERCPSGKLRYEVDGQPVEPDLPEAISVTKDGPLWVTGGIPVTMSNGQTLEVRNRVTLCRCGQLEDQAAVRRHARGGQVHGRVGPATGATRRAAGVGDAARSRRQRPDSRTAVRWRRLTRGE